MIILAENIDEASEKNMPRSQFTFHHKILYQLPYNTKEIIAQFLHQLSRIGNRVFFLVSELNTIACPRKLG